MISHRFVDFPRHYAMVSATRFLADLPYPACPMRRLRSAPFTQLVLWIQTCTAVTHAPLFILFHFTKLLTVMASHVVVYEVLQDIMRSGRVQLCGGHHGSQQFPAHDWQVVPELVSSLSQRHSRGSPKLIPLASHGGAQASMLPAHNFLCSVH